MLAQFAKQAAASLGLRCSAPALLDGSSALRSLAVRGYAQVVEGLKYLPSHEWVKVEGDSATVGISDFAQHELGDVVYVELPEVGSQVAQGNTFGVVESVKAASDIYSPISGEVVETNAAVVDDPAKVNSDPFGTGWLIKLKVTDAGELDSLLDSAAYQGHVDAGGH